MCKQRSRFVLSALALAFVTSPLVAEEPGSPEIPARGGFSLELSLADVGIDRFEDHRLAIGVRPRWCPRNRWNGRVCFWVDVCRILRPWPDPWPGLVAPGVPLSDLETGPGWMFASNVELELAPEARLRPAVYAGVGFGLTEGNTTDLGARGRYTIGASWSPLLSYGFMLATDLSPRTTLRLQLGATTEFMDDMTVTGVLQGQPVVSTAQGGSVTNGIVGVSFAVRFGGCQ